MKHDDDEVRVVEDLPQYANGAGVKVMPLDIMVEFSLTDGASEKFTRVIMTPELAKGLQHLLNAGIDRFEKDHGPIRDITRIFTNRPSPGKSQFISTKVTQ